MASQSSADTLASIGAESIRLFSKVKSISIQPNEFPSWLAADFATEAEKFELWAINLGLFVPGHGSLDYRVREAQALDSVLRHFLGDLNDSLLEVLECSSESQTATGDTPGHTWSPSTFEESLETGFEGAITAEIDAAVLLDDVKDIVQRLYKISVQIRNPKYRLGSSKALHYKDVDPESGVDLLSIYENFDYDYVRSLFLQYRKSKALAECSPSQPRGVTDAEPSQEDTDQVWEPINSILQVESFPSRTESSLIARLARANVRRRQQFAYWKKHRNKLNQHALVFSKPADPQLEKVTYSNPISPQTCAGLVEPQQPPPQSITTASHLHPSVLNFNGNLSTLSISEYAPSAWQPDKEAVSFPEPPKQLPEREFFECPYCFTLCPVKMLSKSAWRAHLIHDLRPYVCTYEDCTTPDQQYDRRQDWIAHKNSHRKVWYCLEHPDETFYQLAKYKEHLFVQHVNFNEETLNVMASTAESTLISPDRCCSICLLSFNTAEALNSHIALHLERLSLFSLPRAPDHADDVDDADSHDAQALVDESRDGDFLDDGEFDNEGEAVEVPDNNEAEGASPISAVSSVFSREQPDKLRTHMESSMKELGASRLDTLTSITNLASTYRNQGQWQEAEKLEVQVMETRLRVLGEEHPDTLTSMANLASTYGNQGRWQEAEKLEVQVMETRLRVLGEEHPDTLTSMNNLAWIYWNQGRWQEAEKLEVQVMETRLRVLGEEHPDTLTSMNNLAWIYWNQGRWSEAEKIQLHVMETSLRVLGVEHPDTLTSMTNLASTYRNQGRWQEAEKLEVQVMETSLRVLGAESPSTLTSMANLALTFGNQGRWQEAEKLEVQVMETSARVLGGEHPDTLTSMNNLAYTWYAQSREAEALQLMNDCVSASVKVLGRDHSNTKSRCQTLLDWQGDPSDGSTSSMSLDVRNDGGLNQAGLDFAEEVSLETSHGATQSTGNTTTHAKTPGKLA